MNKEVVEGYLSPGLSGFGGGVLRKNPMNRVKSAFWKLGDDEVDFAYLPKRIKQKFSGKKIRVTFEEVD